MGLTNEEIRVRMGLDVSALDNAVGVRGAAKKSAESAAQEYKKWGKEAAGEIKKTSDFFAFAFENSFQETFKSLKRIVALNLIELGLHAKEYWDSFSRYIAETYYGVGSRIVELTGRLLDANRQFFREARREQAESAKSADQERAKIAAAAGDWFKLNDSIADSVKRQMQLREQMAIMNARSVGDLKKVQAEMSNQHRLEDKTLEKQKAYAEGELQAARASGDKLKIQQAELDLAKAKEAILQAQLSHRREELGIEQQIKAMGQGDAQNALPKSPSKEMQRFLKLQEMLDPGYHAPFDDRQKMLGESQRLFDSMTPDEKAALTGAAKGSEAAMKTNNETLGQMLDLFKSKGILIDPSSFGK